MGRDERDREWGMLRVMRGLLSWLAFAIFLAGGPRCPSAGASAETKSPRVEKGATNEAEPAPDKKSEEYREKAEKIRELSAGQLDPELIPTQLFRIDLQDEREVTLEARRLAAELSAAGIDLKDAPEKSEEAATVDETAKDVKVEEKDETAESTKSSLSHLDPQDALWFARLELDKSRYDFLSLPLKERQALLKKHEERVAAYQETQAPPALSEAESDALAAAKEREIALEKAKAARSEASRRVSEENARLLDVLRLQAEFQSELAAIDQKTRTRSESLLSWQRRVEDTLQEQPSSRVVDALYKEIRTSLQKEQRSFARKLSKVIPFRSAVPQPGEDRLLSLPEGADRSSVTAQRRKVREKAKQLTGQELKLQRASARELMSAVHGLNTLRLELLPFLSQDMLGSTTGFDRSGWRQALAETQQVLLSVRYRTFAVREWIKESRESSESRKESAWTAGWFLVRWVLPLTLFFWWRRRADEVLKDLRKRFAQERRKYRRRDPGAERPERFVSFFLRVRHPLEWLILVNLGVWLLPTGTADLSKAGAVLTSLNWIFCGRLAVRILDALSSSEVRGYRPSRRGAERAQLRLRSLRLIGNAVVSFGLVLSLSADFVGRGTLFDWVVLCSWFAALPVLLVIISWWRPVIFERFKLSRRKRPFENWVLANREGTISFLAAVAGGVYLFSYGIFRTVRSWIVTFSVTRRILAYLFRRGMERHAKSASAPDYKELPAKQLEILSLRHASPEFIPGPADDALKEIIKKINLPGGGIFAIVGERGLGKSTLLDQISDAVGDVVSIACPLGGVEAFEKELNQALRHSHSVSMETSAEVLNTKILDSAMLVDDAQRLIQPTIGGLAELDRVLDLARGNSSNCAWVFAFDAVIWRFLERARGARPLFDDVIYLRPWSEESIVQLLTSRNKAAQISPSFEDLVTELPPNADEIDKEEALQKTETGYYRLLWDYASGNPAVALHFWCDSLGLNADSTHKVRLFSAPSAEDLESLPDSAVFVLRAIVQLGHAELGDICRATALPERQVLDALRYGTVRGYFDLSGDRYHISWNWFRAITRFLYRRHLIFSGAG